MLPDDSDNPFIAGFSSASKIAEPQMLGFTTAAGLRSARDIDRSPSPEVPPVDQNYDDWFKPASVDVSTDFVVTSFTTASAIKGFGKVPFILPSEESLAKAKARMAAWEKEDSILEGKLDVPENPSSPSKHIQMAGFKTSISSERQETGSRYTSQRTKCSRYATFSSVETNCGDWTPKHEDSTPPTTFRFQITTANVKTVSNLPGSPLNAVLTASSTSGNRHPLSGTPVTAARLMQNTTHSDMTPSSFSTPLRSNLSSRNRPAKFLTPFKPNMRPGEPGRLSLPQSGNPSPLRRR
jgi:breast cancer 2 susceptibility protein